MADLVFSIQGIQNVIEELKSTRCHCSNESCMNNAAWIGRKTRMLGGKCLLSEVELGLYGNCEQAQGPGDDLNSPYIGITTYSLAQLQEAVSLLKRVDNEATLITPDVISIKASLLGEIRGYFISD